MTAPMPGALLEQQVELTKRALQLKRGMEQHLTSAVMPHLGGRAVNAVRDLFDELQDDEDGIHPNLAIHLDTVIGDIRKQIAAGAQDEKVAISGRLLIGCSEAVETRRTYSSEAQALQKALPPLEQLYAALREAFDFFNAIRVSLRLLNLEQD